MEAMVNYQCEECNQILYGESNLSRHMKTKHNSHSKPKNRRTCKRKYKIQPKPNILKMVGVNAAGLASKLNSFDKILSDLMPGVFFVQETKMRKMGNIKTECAKKYQIYELVRKCGGGGGLALGVIQNLSSVWLGEGDDEIESISVQITVHEMRIRCVVA